MIKSGQRVKCFLNTSIVVEGIVVNWGKQVELQTLNGESLLIIHHPERDIVMTRVFPNTENDTNTPKPPVDDNPSDFAVDPNTDPMALRAKSMAELKVAMITQEKEMVAHKMRDHHPTGMVNKVVYHYPSFLKQK